MSTFIDMVGRDWQVDEQHLIYVIYLMMRQIRRDAAKREYAGIPPLDYFDRKLPWRAMELKYGTTAMLSARCATRMQIFPSLYLSTWKDNLDRYGMII